MSTAAAPLSRLDGETPEPKDTWWKKAARFAVRRRIPISLCVFIVLIAEDVLESVRPHDLTDMYDLKSVLGLGLVLGGLAVRSWAAGILRKKEQLATSGPYALVRHPLYVGSFMMMVGFCTLIGDAENIWFVLGPFVALYILGILAEERALSERFGESWQEYANAVPRLLPRRLRPEVFASWSADQWLRNHEYRAVGAVLMGLAALQVWHML